MRALVLLALIASTAQAQTYLPSRGSAQTPIGGSQGTRFLEPNWWRLGQSSAPAPLFQFAPASGAGMTAECAGAMPTGSKGETITWAGRTSVAWCTKSDYSLVQVASGQIRVMRGRPDAPLGVLREHDATNLVIDSNDLADAGWTASNITCTKMATGPDLAANSASVCTASLDGGTVLQAVTLASAANATSLYIQRQTGNGGVEVTRNGGSTWNDITSQLAALSTNWGRVVCEDTEGCMGGRCIIVPDLCATSANPSVGLKLDKGGDAVNVWGVQNEAGDSPSSPITTGAATASRVRDGEMYATLTFVPGSLRAGFVFGYAQTNSYAVFPSTGAAAPFVTLYAAAPVSTFGSNVGCIISSGGTIASGAYFGAGGHLEYSCDLASDKMSASAGGYRTDAVSGFSRPTTTRLYIGGTYQDTNTDTWRGVISTVCADSVYGKCTTASVIGARSTAWLGDSIVHGEVSAPIRPAIQLYSTYGQYQSQLVQDWGFPGFGTVALSAKWNQLKLLGYSRLITMMGVNDLRVGTSAATIWPTYKSILDEAVSRGFHVTPVHVLCWGNWSEWTAAKQTQTDLLNADLDTWCAANGATCVDTSSMCTGNNLQAGYDSGDGLHPNANGASAFVALVKAANP